MFVASLLALAAAVQPAPAMRKAYPKLYRCQSPIERPAAAANASPACLDFRRDQLARLQALPARQRIARVQELRRLTGTQSGQGLDIRSDGTLFEPAAVDGPDAGRRSN